MENTNPQTTLDTEIISLRSIKAFNEHVADILDDRKYPYEKLCATIAQVLAVPQVLVFTADNANATLDYAGSYPVKRVPEDEQPSLSISILRVTRCLKRL